MYAWHCAQHVSDAQNMAGVIPLGCRTMKEGAWSGPWLDPGSLTQSLALVGTYFCVFINYLFGRVIHILIPSCNTNLLWTYCAESWDYSSELDKESPCLQEVYVFMSYLKEERALPCPVFYLSSEMTQVKEFTSTDPIH